MRTVWKWALVLAVPAACVAAGQPAEKLVPEGTTVPLLLLRQKSVQQELKLSPDVTRKVYEFTAKQWQAAQKALKASKEEREQQFDHLEMENKQFLAKTLTAEQHKRLDQITMQLTGLMQLARPEVARLLKLTPDQQEKFRHIQKESRKEFAEIIHATGRAGRDEELAKLRKTTRERVQAVLTEEQRAQVRALVGAPFEGKIMLEGPKSASKE